MSLDFTERGICLQICSTFAFCKIHAYWCMDFAKGRFIIQMIEAIIRDQPIHNFTAVTFSIKLAIFPINMYLHEIP